MGRAREQEWLDDFDNLEIKGMKRRSKLSVVKCPCGVIFEVKSILPSDSEGRGLAIARKLLHLMGTSRERDLVKLVTFALTEKDCLVNLLGADEGVTAGFWIVPPQAEQQLLFAHLKSSRYVPKIWPEYCHLTLSSKLFF
jgi:hypothetical protein